MGIENTLERIAKSLETLLDVLAEAGKVQTTVTSNDVIAEPVEEPKKKKRTKKTKTPKTEPPKVETSTLTTEQYKTEMHNAANLISGFSPDAKTKSEMFAELQARFKKAYPNRQHVFDVAPEEQEDVINLVGNFLKEKGVV